MTFSVHPKRIASKSRSGPGRVHELSLLNQSEPKENEETGERIHCDQDQGARRYCRS